MNRFEKCIARWRDTINDLKKQQETAKIRMVELGEAKKPLTLAGHTGDLKAKSKLAQINAEIRVVEQESADLAEAITQAEAKLSDAEAEKARRDEIKRLQRVRGLAEQKIEMAEEVETKARELAELCEKFERSGFEMGRAGGWPVGDGRLTRADGRGRLLLCLRKHIGPIFGDPPNPNDPRFGQELADIERDALGEFLLSDRGIKKVSDGAA